MSTLEVVWRPVQSCYMLVYVMLCLGLKIYLPRPIQLPYCWRFMFVFIFSAYSIFISFTRITGVIDDFGILAFKVVFSRSF